MLLKFIRSLFSTVALVLCVQSSGFALTNEEVFSQFQFNFITPGARATALGGAFIGLADDATAVDSNPAGLTQLYETEVSLEGKHIAYTTNQVFENLQYSTDITRRDFENAVQGLSFASVAFPYKRVVFAVYRQELLNYESSFQTSQYPLRYMEPDGRKGAIYSIGASTNLTVVNYGIGLAVQPFEGLSFAVSPRWSEMKLEAFSKRFKATATTDIFDNPQPTDFADKDIVNSTSIDDSDGNFSLNAGFMWRLQWLEEKLHFSRVSIGAVYRSGAKFEITETFHSTVFLSEQPTWADVSDLSKFTLQVPDSYGFGIAVRPMNDLTLTLDIVQIRYKNLLEDFDVIIDPSGVTTDEYTVDNATEVHFGAEYLLELGERLLALRIGVYNDPDHTIRYTGNNTVQKILFPGGENQLHVTGGVGLVISEHFQIDTAANIADRNKQLSVSAVYRF